MWMLYCKMERFGGEKINLLLVIIYINCEHMPIMLIENIIHLKLC